MATPEARTLLSNFISGRVLRMHGGLPFTQRAEFEQKFNYWPDGQRKSQKASSDEIIYGDIFQRGGILLDCDVDVEYKAVVVKMAKVLGEALTPQELNIFKDIAKNYELVVYPFGDPNAEAIKIPEARDRWTYLTSSTALTDVSCWNISRNRKVTVIMLNKHKIDQDGAEFRTFGPKYFAEFPVDQKNEFLKNFDSTEEAMRELTKQAIRDYLHEILCHELIHHILERVAGISLYDHGPLENEIEEISHLLLRGGSKASPQEIRRGLMLTDRLI